MRIGNNISGINSQKKKGQHEDGKKLRSVECFKNSSM
jgi:hypothetical protein